MLPVVRNIAVLYWIHQNAPSPAKLFCTDATDILYWIALYSNNRY
jgi:hypothetical protein